MKGKSSDAAHRRIVVARKQEDHSPLIQRHRRAIQRIASLRAANYQVRFEELVKSVRATRARLKHREKNSPRHIQEALQDLLHTVEKIEQETKKMERLRKMFPGKKYPSTRSFIKQISHRAAAKFALDTLAYGYEGENDVAIRKKVDVLFRSPDAIRFIQSAPTRESREWLGRFVKVIGKEEFVAFRKAFLDFYELLVRPVKDA